VKEGKKRLGSLKRERRWVAFIGGVSVEISVSLGIGVELEGCGLDFALTLKPGSLSLLESSNWYK
jgi:hypothetical protein